MNLLLIDETIPSKDLFIEGINETTKYITYSISDSFDNLTQKIADLSLNYIENIGLVFVDDRNPLKMFVSYNAFISYADDIINQNNTTEFIKNIVSTYNVKNLDFLACNLLSYDIWKKYFEFIMSENTGLVVRASNDQTGNLSIGGDWVLESTNEDITTLYFNDKLSNWNEFLDAVTNGNSGFVGIDGMVYATGNNDFGQMNNGRILNSKIFVDIDTSDVIATSYGQYHIGIIKKDGSVWMCGTNTSGQLGIGNTTSQSSFVRSKYTFSGVQYDISDAVTISCGYTHTGIIRQDGSLWMCGANGQLGTGSGSTTFIKVMTEVSKISCGWSHSGVIKSDGTVWTTGLNNFGQLGINVTGSSRTAFVKCNYTINNSNYYDISDAIAISCGGLHTGIIRQGGSVWMAGLNNTGELGHGYKDGNGQSTSFRKSTYNNGVTTVDVSDAIAISCGTYFSGIIRSNGSVWMCGLNDRGQLGIASTASTTPFTRSKYTLSSVNYDISDAIALSCGESHTAIIRQGGTLWTCGRNVELQLGDNTGILKTTFVQSQYHNGSSVTNITDASSIECGATNTAVIRNNGYLFTVGLNTSGQLGYNVNNNTYYKIYNQKSRSVSFGTNFTAIIKDDGTLWTCGINANGQLGIGNTTNSSIFNQSIDASNVPLSNVIAVSCGASHTGIVKSDGSVWTCGYNFRGQLGIGSNTDQTKFTKTPITNASSISCGNLHTIVLKNDGTVWASGSNHRGQLGTNDVSGNQNSITSFKQCLDTSNIPISNCIAISCGDFHTSILRADGSMWGTGANNVGHYSTGDIVDYIVFKKSTITSDAVAVCSGGNHTGVIKSDGSLWMCGYNNVGQLGNGTRNDTINYFAQITDVSNIVGIHCGFSHTVIINKDGSLFGTGLNSAGQLGTGTFTTSTSNKFILASSTVKPKSVSIPYKDISNNSNNISSIQNTSNVYTYFPNMASSKNTQLTTTDKTNSSTNINITTPGKKIISLGPANTSFSDYVYFDIPVSSTGGLKVYFKSESDSSQVEISTTDTGYGAYYSIVDLRTIRTYTKHFSEVGVGFFQLGGVQTNPPMDFKVSIGSTVYSITSDSSNNLYVAGNFTTVGEDLPYHYIAKYDYNGIWHDLSYNNIDLSHIIYDTAIDSSNNLYVATSNGLQHYNLNNGGPWINDISGNNIIYKLLINGNDIYLGGTFTSLNGTSCNNIAIFNKLTNNITALGSGITNSSGSTTPEVHTLAYESPNLYVGGDFNQAGGNLANNIAVWNGSTWAQVGGGITHTGGSGSQKKTGIVNYILFHNDALYIGGHFDRASGSPISTNIAKYTLGQGIWSSLGSGLGSSLTSTDNVANILFNNNILYAFGTFDSSLNNMAQYSLQDQTPSWIPLGKGVQGTSPIIYTSYKSGDRIFIGGTFTSTNNLVISNVGMYSLEGKSIGDRYYKSLRDASDNTVSLNNYLNTDNLNRLIYGTDTLTYKNDFKSYIRSYYNKFTSEKTAMVSWENISKLFTQTDSTFNGSPFKFVLLNDTLNNTYSVNLSEPNPQFYYYFPFTFNDKLTLNIDASDYDISYNSSQRRIYFGGTGYDASSQIIQLDPNNADRTMTIRGIGSGGLELHCLTDMCNVLTPDGYKNVKYINVGDIILTEDNREVRVKRKTHELYIINEHTAPYLIPKNTIDNKYPTEDIVLSGRHLIKYNDKWYIPEKIGIKQLDIYSVNYYHLELENYTTDNIIINGGTVVESLTTCDDENQHRDAVEWYRRYFN